MFKRLESEWVCLITLLSQSYYMALKYWVQLIQQNPVYRKTLLICLMQNLIYHVKKKIFIYKAPIERQQMQLLFGELGKFSIGIDVLCNTIKYSQNILNYLQAL